MRIGYSITIAAAYESHWQCKRAIPIQIQFLALTKTFQS